MMKLTLAVIAILLFLAGVILLRGLAENKSPSPTSVLQSPTSAPQTQSTDFKASFQITTQGVVRSFQNSKYHQKSPDVFLAPDDKTIVYVKKSGITWDDFFKTLPMKLTKVCLTTGDGEIFCSGQNGTLRFYLNSKEDPDLLDREIKDGDKAEIEF